MNVYAGNLSCRTCQFELNWVSSSGSEGGGVRMSADSVSVLDGNSFISKSAPAGGAVYVLSGFSIPSLKDRKSTR